MRTFALTRLTKPELLRERFRRQAGFSADEYLKGSFTVFKGRQDYEVVIEFDAWATDLVRGRTWHASQEFVALAGGGSRLRLRLNNIADIEPWVLSWGTHATVIRPLELAKRVEQTARELTLRYPKLGSPSEGD
jgi:predicted DNA-binding transcriptional regulator YafY